jgi:hypothetical protein
MKHVPSISTTPRRFGSVLGAALALGLIALACGSAAAATAPIYKCLDRNLGLVYTDVPCKDGERMDLRAGDADPVAVARLERERDALDRSAAQRIADERHAALQRIYSPPDYAPYYDAAPYAEAAEYFPYWYGVLAYAPVARQRAASARNDRRSARQSVVPNRMHPPVR